MNMVGCDSEAIRYRDTVVSGYVVVYGCAEGNRLAKWYWDCEHHKSLRVNAGIRKSRQWCRTVVGRQVLPL